MKCYLCNKNADIKQQNNRYICDNCFSRIFEKRIRKFVRMNKVFRKDDIVLVIGDVNKELVKRIIGKRPLNVYFKSKEDKEFIKKNKINKVIVEWTLDDEANCFLLELFRRKKQKRLDKDHVKFLVDMTDEDVIEFARINRLKFKPNKKDKDVMKLVNELQKEHPSAKYTLIKNIEELKKRLLID